MSQATYYSDIKILKKPLKIKIKNFFKFFLIMVVVVGCFLSAKYLSRALTVGNLGALIVYGDTKIKTDENVFYAVTLGEYVDKLEAERVALGSTVQGAGGYVWEKDDRYYVVGNVYVNYADAQKVLENLSNTKYAVSIMEITFGAINIDFSMYENSDMDIINKAINVFDSVYTQLYDYSIRYDKKEITHLAISSGVSEMRGNIKSIIVDVQNLINKSQSDLTKIQNALIKLDELLDQTIIKTIDNSSTSYSIKYSLISVVRIKYELFSVL